MENSFISHKMLLMITHNRLIIVILNELSTLNSSILISNMVNIDRFNPHNESYLSLNLRVQSLKNTVIVKNKR